MKLALAVSALSAAVVLAAPAEKICDNAANCYAGVHGWGGYVHYEPYQGNLMDACRNDENAVGGTGNLWGTKACVALAVSDTRIGVSRFGLLVDVSRFLTRACSRKTYRTT